MHCGKAQVGSALNLCPRFNPGSPELNPGRRSNSGPDINLPANFANTISGVPRLLVEVRESREVIPECPEELSYAGALALVSETLYSLKGRLEAWKRTL